MERKQIGAISSSRFRFQQVRTNQRSEITVDMGCQRCQHCMLRRQLWHAAVVGLPALDQNTPDEKQEGGHPCR